VKNRHFTHCPAKRRTDGASLCYGLVTTFGPPLVAVSYDDLPRRTVLPNLSNQSSFRGHSGRIAGIAVSPDGSKAVSGAYTSQSFDRDAIIWRLPSGDCDRRLCGHEGGVFSVAYSPDGRTIATGGGGAVKGRQWVHDDAIRLWIKAGEPCGKFGEDLFFVHALAFSPDGKFLLSGSEGDRLRGAMQIPSSFPTPSP
jgi:WD40 repeat protein